MCIPVVAAARVLPVSLDRYASHQWRTKGCCHVWTRDDAAARSNRRSRTGYRCDGKRHHPCHRSVQDLRDRCHQRAGFDRRRLRGRARRDGRGDGPVRLRQDDAAQLPLRARHRRQPARSASKARTSPTMSRPASAPTTGRSGWASSSRSTTCCRCSTRSRTSSCRCSSPASGRRTRASRRWPRWRRSAWRTGPTHRPAELSGGQRQRVTIARVARQRPGHRLGRRADRRARLQDGRRDHRPDARAEPAHGLDLRAGDARPGVGGGATASSA